jgi:hypothetical protein
LSFPFCVGLESKEHNTFWESKRKQQLLLSSLSFSQVFWVLPTFSLLGGEVLASWPKQSKAKVKCYSVIPCLCLVYYYYYYYYYFNI